MEPKQRNMSMVVRSYDRAAYLSQPYIFQIFIEIQYKGVNTLLVFLSHSIQNSDKEFEKYDVASKQSQHFFFLGFTFVEQLANVSPPYHGCFHPLSESLALFAQLYTKLHLYYEFYSECEKTMTIPLHLSIYLISVRFRIQLVKSVLRSVALMFVKKQKQTIRTFFTWSTGRLVHNFLI